MIEQIYHILCRVISEEVFRSSTMLQVEFDMPKPKSVLILFERWFFLTFFGKKWKKCIKTQVIYFGARQGTPRLCMLVRTHTPYDKKFSFTLHWGQYVHYSVCVQERRYPKCENVWSSYTVEENQNFPVFLTILEKRHPFAYNFEWETWVLFFKTALIQFKRARKFSTLVLWKFTKNYSGF